MAHVGSQKEFHSSKNKLLIDNVDSPCSSLMKQVVVINISLGFCVLGRWVQNFAQREKKARKGTLTQLQNNMQDYSLLWSEEDTEATLSWQNAFLITVLLH